MKNSNLFNSLVELIRVTSADLPEDVVKEIKTFAAREATGSRAAYAMNVIQDNIALAKERSAPICQDTGTVLIYVYHPKNFSQLAFKKECDEAIKVATLKGYLRQNSVNPLTGKNPGNNLGPGHPSYHFVEHDEEIVIVKMILKGGGCENVGVQYSLPFSPLNADRDLEGVRKVILDAVVKAQGNGCAPGILGVCIGGDRGAGYVFSKEQLFRKMDDTNPYPVLAKLEERIVKEANTLGIGPMGFGGLATILGCKIGILNRLPASYFVTISYMCWAFRRQGVELSGENSIKRWLY
jgi:fumarate hydratase class I